MASSNISRLQAQMRACAICTDLPLGPNPLFKISAQARILIVGQAPDDPRIGILPMGFCFPGTGKSGDLPPRPECAPQWRKPALAAMPDVALTIVIGREPLTKVVQAWREVWPRHIVMPHPSPRNNVWLKRNPWFAVDVLPELQSRVGAVLRS